MTETDQPNQPNEAPSSTTEGPGVARGSAAPQPAEAAPTAPAPAAPEPQPEPAVDPVEVARQEASAAQDRYLRAIADLENFRRRTIREKDELRAFAAARVVEELLPVLDNLALGLQAAKAPNADLTSLLGGIEMVATQLKTALGNHGLKELNPTGQPFDPNLHEALSQVPSADVPEGSVVQVVRTGYTLNGRLLRPASVIVSGGAPAGKASNR
jgi:molecular chaperone GrpE